jgi:hypothetical protein
MKCEDCGLEMLTAKSCLAPYIKIGTKLYQRVTNYHDINKRCHDCGIVNGNIHHFGCDIERCPKCGDQLIGCNCNKKDLKFSNKIDARKVKI